VMSSSSVMSECCWMTKIIRVKFSMQNCYEYNLDSFRMVHFMYITYLHYIEGCARMNVIGSRTLFVIPSVHCSIH
jgi:hypothetical protein